MGFTSSAAVMRRRLVWLGMALLVLGGVGVTAPVAAGGVVNSSFLGGVAIEGTDPVAYFTESKPVEGSSDFEHEWMGATWRFVGAENRDRFAADPEKIRAAVRRLLRLGGRARLHRQDRSRGLEDRRRQALPQLLQGRAGPVVGGRPGNITKGDANWPRSADLAG